MTASKNRRGEVRVSSTRLAAYAASGAAATLGAASVTNAAITYVDLAPDVVLNDTTTDGYAVAQNLVFGGTHNLALGHGLGTVNAATGYAIFDSDALATPGVDVAGFAVGSFNYARNLPYGANIAAQAFLAAGVGGTMAYNTGFTNSQFLSPGIGFIGVRFSGNRYGWVRVRMDSGAPLNNFTILDYAFGDAGDQLTAGAVPEPTSLAALALGSVGLAAFRGRRNRA